MKQYESHDCSGHTSEVLNFISKSGHSLLQRSQAQKPSTEGTEPRTLAISDSSEDVCKQRVLCFHGGCAFGGGIEGTCVDEIVNWDRRSQVESSQVRSSECNAPSYLHGLVVAPEKATNKRMCAHFYFANSQTHSNYQVNDMIYQKGIVKAEGVAYVLHQPRAWQQQRTFVLCDMWGSDSDSVHHAKTP